MDPDNTTLTNLAISLGIPNGMEELKRFNFR